MSDLASWVVSHGGACWPAGNDQFLWVSTDRSRSALLARAEAVLWQQALTFQSREELLASLAQRHSMPGGVAQAAMNRMLACGVLVSAGEWIGTAALRDPAPSPVIAVRTFRRPQALARLLDSALAMQRRGATPRSWLVIDDARSADEGKDSHEVVARCAREGLEIGYFGPTHRAEAICSLIGAGHGDAKALLDPNVLATASGARSWNWAMLLSAGGTVSMIDDDCVLPVRRPETWHRSWSMQHSATFEGRFYDNEVPRLAELEGDPWEESLGVLGQAPAALAQRDGARVAQIAGKSLAQLSAWHADRRVAAVIAGIHGGHVFNSSFYLSVTDAHSLRDLLRPPFSLQRLQGDALWQGVSSPRLVATAVYTPFLIDNRALLPFAPTAGHADDTAFLALLSAIAPESSFAMLPMLVGHAPIEHRDRLDAMFRELLMDGNTFVSSLAAPFATELPGRGRATRWKAVSAWAQALIDVDSGVWSRHVHVWRDRMLSRALDAIEQAVQLAGADAPLEWRQAIERAASVNRKAIGQPAPERLLVEARTCCTQLAEAAGTWQEWWSLAASGWAKDWRERMRLRG